MDLISVKVRNDDTLMEALQIFPDLNFTVPPVLSISGAILEKSPLIKTDIILFEFSDCDINSINRKLAFVCCESADCVIKQSKSSDRNRMVFYLVVSLFI